MEVHSKSGVPPFYNYRMEMKKILLLAILISTYLTLAASERTDQEMRRIAEKQLRQLKGGTTRSGGYNVEKIIDLFDKTKNNDEFIKVVKKSLQ